MFATYPMAFHTPGGGEMQLLAYRRHLSEQGVQVTLFDPWRPRFLEHDLIHFFSCVGGSSHFCAFVKRLGLPLIVSASLWITEQTAAQYPIAEIRTQLDLADRIVANSDLECDTLARVLQLPRRRFVTVYNAASDHFYQPVAANLFRDHFGIAGRFVLNVGNIEPRKNQLRLVEAMKLFPAVRVVLIGHTRDQEYLAQVLRMGGEQLTYLGPIEHDSPLLCSAYSACELFALPSTLETPGLAALEAAAQGAPLLLTSEGCCAEYFGDSAVYVDPLSSESIRQGIAHALQNSGASTRAQARVCFRWRDATAKLVEVYRSVVRERSAALEKSTND